MPLLARGGAGKGDSRVIHPMTAFLRPLVYVLNQAAALRSGSRSSTRRYHISIRHLLETVARSATCYHMAKKHWIEDAQRCLEESLVPVPHEVNELDWKVRLSEHKDRLAEHLIASANHPDGGSGLRRC